MAYRIGRFPMTLSDLQRHSSVSKMIFRTVVQQLARIQLT